MVFSTEGFFEVTIESWPEFEPTTTEFRSDTLTDYIYTHTYIYFCFRNNFVTLQYKQ